MFAVRATSIDVARTLVVRKLLENQAFPPTVRFAVAAAPMPILDVTSRVAIFAVPATFAEVAETLGVVRLLENQTLPRIVMFAGAPCWL
jgi:Zn-dependent protease with chaperone function